MTTRGKFDLDTQAIQNQLLEICQCLGAEKPALIKQVTYLSFVCRHLERAADHATNIAEYLIDLVKASITN